MDKLGNAYEILKTTCTKISNYDIVHRVKKYTILLVLFIFYICGYFTTGMLDTLTFLYALLVSVKYLKCQQNCKDSFMQPVASEGDSTKEESNKCVARNISDASHVIHTWVTYACVTTMLLCVTMFFSMPFFNMFVLMDDFVRIMCYYFVLSGKLQTKWIVDTATKFYSTNKAGIDIVEQQMSNMCDTTIASVDSFVIKDCPKLIELIKKFKSKDANVVDNVESKKDN
jgi:hypothetical protein